jgi:uncharacterized membrane protein
MDQWLQSARSTLIASAVLAGVLTFAVMLAGRLDPVSASALIARVVHVFSAMVWVGLVLFVNLVQLELMASVGDSERAFLGKAVAPRVAILYRHASTWTVVAGLVLLLTSGYVLPSLVYGASVDLGAPRSMAMTLGTLGGIVMWVLVHMLIWPSLQVAVGLRPGDDAAKMAARAKVKRYARVNLLLALPVTLLMIAAAHGL